MTDVRTPFVVIGFKNIFNLRYLFRVQRVFKIHKPLLFKVKYTFYALSPL